MPKRKTVLIYLILTETVERDCILFHTDILTVLVSHRHLDCHLLDIEILTVIYFYLQTLFQEYHCIPVRPVILRSRIY